MNRRLNVRSETGRLKRVIVHTPGPEVEAMRPSRAEEDLYNDIIPMDIVQAEHAQLKGFLSSVAEVYELKDILAESLQSPEQRRGFAELLCARYDSGHRREELCSLSATELARAAIQGLPARHVRVGDFLKSREYDLPPLPNMYFMRDAAMVYRDKSIASAMRFKVRSPEALIHRFIFERHEGFKGAGRLLDGPALAKEGFALEGGDFQALADNIVAIGVSERTSPEAIDHVARSLADSFGEPFTVFAVELPIARATIHLDMVFTVIDRDACLVFEPVILGKLRGKVARIDIAPGKDPVIHEVPSLLEGLKAAGLDLKPILTGGSDPVRQEREQWLSGANSFSFAPGKIIVYSCNNRTVDALGAAGFEFKQAAELLSGAIDPFSYKRLVVGFDGVELARGGGGARCMTCPVERED
jgi:arginine deiminase